LVLFVMGEVLLIDVARGVAVELGWSPETGVWRLDRVRRGGAVGTWVCWGTRGDDLNVQT
jgi:hypothetical protein